MQSSGGAAGSSAPDFGSFMATNGHLGPSTVTADGSMAGGADGSRIPNILPHERVFPIQIGSELFKLSGASLSSDAPSYFSQYFQCQLKMAEAAAANAAAAAAGPSAPTAAEGSHGQSNRSSTSKSGSPAETESVPLTIAPATATATATAPGSSAIRTLYIDRDPATFRDIALHLQGYHVQPRDGTHFVRLFADAQFYSLPRLIAQLYEQPIFMSIGHREFQIPRDLFQDPGNAPNYFTLGFAVFFSSPDNLFPGLDRAGLLRPPSILPPAVTGRSADTFAELLHLLRGYPVAIRSEAHRQTLLRDCRYFNFRGLEQKLLPHTRAYNQARRRDELLLRVEDVLKSGLSACNTPVGGISAGDAPAGDTPAGSGTSAAGETPTAWVHYARPFVDDKPAELVLEIGGENTRLHFPRGSGSSRRAALAAAAAAGSIRAEFLRDTKTRMARLFEVLATKLNLPTTTTQPLGLLMAHGGAASQPPSPGHTPLCDNDRVRVVLEPDTALVLDGRPLALGRVDDDSQGDNEDDDNDDDDDDDAGVPPRKRRRVDGSDPGASPGDDPDDGPAPVWVVQTGQWRLRIRAAPVAATPGGKSAVECVLVGVKLDAASSELARNRARGFLGGA